MLLFINSYENPDIEFVFSYSMKHIIAVPY